MGGPKGEKFFFAFLDEFDHFKHNEKSPISSAGPRPLIKAGSLIASPVVCLLWLTPTNSLSTTQQCRLSADWENILQDMSDRVTTPQPRGQRFTFVDVNKKRGVVQKLAEERFLSFLHKQCNLSHWSRTMEILSPDWLMSQVVSSRQTAGRPTWGSRRRGSAGTRGGGRWTTRQTAPRSLVQIHRDTVLWLVESWLWLWESRTSVQAQNIQIRNQRIKIYFNNTLCRWYRRCSTRLSPTPPWTTSSSSGAIPLLLRRSLGLLRF